MNQYDDDHAHDLDLDARSYTRRYRDEVAIVLSAVDCILNGEKAAYASSDLTTGRRFYRLLRESGARSSADLRRKLGEARYRAELFEPNATTANAFARTLRSELGGASLVITPAPLFAPGWSQLEYLAFFEVLLKSRVNSVFFNDGWEYSNGCTFEFAVAQEVGLPTFDRKHVPIDRAVGLSMIERAATELEVDGLDPVGLRRNQSRLIRVLKPPVA